MTEKELIENFFKERKVEEVSLIDIHDLSPFYDYCLIATAGNIRQLSAYSEELSDLLAQNGYETRKAEGEPDSGWIIIDGGEVIVHLFTESKRKMYGLEELLVQGKEKLQRQ